jgi:membrane peptidoglycan carboxypeptidase
MTHKTVATDDMPGTSFPPDTSLPETPKPPKKSHRRYKILILAFAVIGFVLTAAILAYLAVSKTDSGQTSSIHTFTYYYRDGKTVLWQGVEPFAADSPAFVYRVVSELKSKYGGEKLKQGEWKIVTTLDKPLQDVAQAQVEAQREQLGKQEAQDAAMIAQDVSTGQIVSWVVGLDNVIEFSDEDRLSTQTQAGTLALPLVYAAYIDNTGVDANTTVSDIQQPLPGYLCNNRASLEAGGDCLWNFDRKYLGQMTLRQALGGLRLVPAVQAMTSVIANDDSPIRVDSINKTIAVMEAMMGKDDGYSCYLESDFESETQCYTAAAIGDGAYAAPQDLIQAYSTLSNNGKRLPQTSLLKVELNGKVAHEWKTPKGKEVVEESTAHIITDILSDQNASYMTRKSWFRIADTKISVMTGHTNDGLVASTVQYSSQYAVGFWAFGGQDPSQKIRGFAETLVLPPVSNWLEAVYNP